MEEVEDLSKMKVADLKKHLKSKGLSVAGNKTELVERLQQALQSDGNPTLDAGAVDDDEFDEEEILGGDDDDIDKITQEEEAAALAGKLTVKEDSLLGKTKPEKKKISLKRSQPSLSSATEPDVPEVSATTEEKVTSNTDESTNDKENSEENVEESKHKKIKLAPNTEENVIEARAKKFGTAANTETDENRKVARAARFGVEASNSSTTSNGNKRVPKLSMEVGSTDLDKLKKRAERFGEVTSKSLSKLEELEKKKQRQNRFTEGESEKSETKSETKSDSKSDSTTEEKKAKDVDVTSDSVKAAKADKLGATKENGTTKVAITAPEKEVDAKQKRAQRFA